MSALFYIALSLLMLLAVHHGARVRRGLRTGIVEGLVLGYWGRGYSREAEPVAFWVNVGVGIFVAALGIVAILWASLVVAMEFSDHPL